MFFSLCRNHDGAVAVVVCYDFIFIYDNNYGSSIPGDGLIWSRRSELGVKKG